jgi:3'-phosphoadenosine 5'-phosphosulfate sulfotransferase (PAPS reductase)/FAD synthetase
MSFDFSPGEIGSKTFLRRVEMLLEVHKKVALAFSGGRDSIAMRHVLKPFLSDITLVWVNSGNLFPEILEYMGRIRATTPRFVEIKTNQPESIRNNGYPVDVLPIDYTEYGSSCTEPKDIKLRSYLDCCVENISLPMYNYIKDNGYTLMFRGNRASEGHRSPGSNGDIQEGVQFVSLIEKWSDQDVLDFLEARGEEITPRLRIGHSSLDCKDCTAFTCHSLERMSYIRKYHPDTFLHLKPVFMKIDRAVRKETEGLKKILSL